VPIIEEQVSLRLWDLCDDAGQKLESVDLQQAGEKLARVVVVRGFGSVENMRRAWGPLHSGKAHGRAEYVTGDVFESFSLSCGDTDGIIDAKS